MVWGQNVSMIWVKEEVETRITRASICKWLKLGVSGPASAHSTQLCIKIISNGSPKRDNCLINIINKSLSEDSNNSIICHNKQQCWAENTLYKRIQSDDDTQFMGNHSSIHIYQKISSHKRNEAPYFHKI